MEKKDWYRKTRKIGTVHRKAITIKKGNNNKSLILSVRSDPWLYNEQIWENRNEERPIMRDSDTREVEIQIHEKYILLSEFGR